MRILARYLERYLHPLFFITAGIVFLFQGGFLLPPMYEQKPK
jgi:hypothetical protein